jgi:hypothetical protein
LVCGRRRQRQVGAVGDGPNCRRSWCPGLGIRGLTPLPITFYPSVMRPSHFPRYPG